MKPGRAVPGSILHSPISNLLYNTRMLIEEEVGQMLLERHYTLAVAESCTGGLVGHRLTNIAGSSAYYLGGVVAYAYDAKERLLDVNHNTLYDFGAVSEQTAREMARGCGGRWAPTWACR
jgi:nicotinamide-nucleotide amidase